VGDFQVATGGGFWVAIGDKADTDTCASSKVNRLGKRADDLRFFSLIKWLTLRFSGAQLFARRFSSVWLCASIKYLNYVFLKVLFVCMVYQRTTVNELRTNM